jgi:lipoate-protein ligase A
MAVDESLFESVQAGGLPVLRLYRWHPGCLSLGRNQPAGSFDGRLASSRGIDIVRRPTGGSAVYHDRELTYAVALPVGPLGGPRATYAAVNQALAAGLRRLGIAAESRSPVRVSAPTGRGATAGPAVLAADPCFHRAADGEVVAGGRKLVGSAQRCVARTLLQHGSILIGGDQSEVRQLERTAPVDTACTSIESLLGRAPGPQQLENAILAGFMEELGVAFDATRLTADEEARARTLAKRYRSNEWTWRL